LPIHAVWECIQVRSTWLNELNQYLKFKMTLNKIKKYKIIGMDCPSCAMLIESELEDAGVKAKVSYAKQTLEIEDADNSFTGHVSKIVSGLGYKLEE